MQRQHKGQRMEKDKFPQALVYIYSLFPMIIVMMSLLLFFYYLRAPSSIENFFKVIFALVWAVVAFIISYTLLSFHARARIYMTIFCAAYVIAGIALLFDVNILLFDWTVLNCWSPPNLCAGCTCAYDSPVFMQYSGIVTFIVSFIGLIIFTLSKAVKSIFIADNRLQYTLDSKK